MTLTQAIVPLLGESKSSPNPSSSTRNVGLGLPTVKSGSGLYIREAPLERRRSMSKGKIMKVTRAVAISAIGAAVIAPHLASADTARPSALLEPRRVEIDHEATHPLTYVYYVDREAFTQGRKVMPNVQRGHSVAADVDERGALMGIEMLDMSAETLRTASALAAEYGAAFPTFLRAADL